MSNEKALTTGEGQSPMHLNGDRVVSVAGICGGDARVRGTRIPVWGLVRAKQHGCTDQQIISMYPQISGDDLAAAWEYAHAHQDEVAAQIRANEEP